MILVMGAPAIVWGQMRRERIPSLAEWIKVKDVLDDPRPLYKGEGDPKTYLPPEMYKKLSFDVETMKKTWADTIGVKSTDEVGKIAPEIKPGTYSYKDKDKYPFKEVMLPIHYKRFNPGAPPHAGNFPDIKVVPTRQYYWALPIAEATRKNEGKTKLDDKGYWLAETYDTGLPFPRPSGKFKTQQILYNWMKRYSGGENMTEIQRGLGFDKRVVKDWDSTSQVWLLKGNGRVLLEPYGWLDDRAKKRGEEKFWSGISSTPQDSAGNAMATIYFDDVNTYDQLVLYFNQIRRLRKLSSEDTQDPFPGTDVIYDDSEGFQQKMSPNRFPYKFELIGEREYLLPSYTLDGSYYYTSKNYVEFKNAEFERRPCYVIQLTQLDPNYIYSKRIMLIDKETFLLLYNENYDRKGRLYRTQENTFVFFPEMGMIAWTGGFYMDHIDLHSSLAYIWMDPFAYWVKRENTGMGWLQQKGK